MNYVFNSVGVMKWLGRCYKICSYNSYVVVNVKVSTNYKEDGKNR